MKTGRHIATQSIRLGKAFAGLTLKPGDRLDILEVRQPDVLVRIGLERHWQPSSLLDHRVLWSYDLPAANNHSTGAESDNLVALAGRMQIETLEVLHVQLA